MIDVPDDKSILTAANQVLSQYKGDVREARLHASRLSDEMLKKGDMDGRQVWERIHRAIFDLTDEERDGRTVH